MISESGRVTTSLENTIVGKGIASHLVGGKRQTKNRRHEKTRKEGGGRAAQDWRRGKLEDEGGEWKVSQWAETKVQTKDGVGSKVRVKREGRDALGG